MSLGATGPDLFIYGTLLHRPLLDTLLRGLGGAVSVPATLCDHRVERQAGADLPILMEFPGGVATGEVWRGLSAEQRARLDTYEVPFGYAARAVAVTPEGGAPGPALAYFPAAPELRSSGDVWSLDGWTERHSAATMYAARELAAHVPDLSGAALVRQWPMILGRAEAAIRVQNDPRPAIYRFAPAPGDVTAQVTSLQGDFFKFAQIDLSHRRFDGGRASGLMREIFVGVDAALVLPWDAARRRVLLVEQLRAGPAYRGDRNPWTLEPVAGIVDAGETPEEAAHREGAEEAGLQFTALTRMFAAYASPGSTTDYFHCYLGAADLPDDLPRRGGLASEAEDLALHLLSLEEAMGLIDSGDITALPLIAMLGWLAARA